MSEKRSKMYIGLHIKYPLFLSCFNETNFLDRFSKNNQISNFMIIRPAATELFHTESRTDGQTDGRRNMTKLIVVFYDFSKVPKNINRIQ